MTKFVHRQAMTTVLQLLCGWQWLWDAIVHLWIAEYGMSTLALCSLGITALPDFLSYILGERSLLYSIFSFFPSLLVSRQWQYNDLYLTGIFILNPKGERNWYYWVTIIQPLSCIAYTILKATLQDSAIILILGEETHSEIRWNNLPRSHSLEAQARMLSWCHAAPSLYWGPKGRRGYLTGFPKPVPGMDPGLGQTVQFI